MAKRKGDKPTRPGGSARRKEDGRQVRIRVEFIAPLKKLCKRNNTRRAEEVNRAVRELLTREELWPPPEPG